MVYRRSVQMVEGSSSYCGIPLKIDCHPGNQSFLTRTFFSMFKTQIHQISAEALWHSPEKVFGYVPSQTVMALSQRKHKGSFEHYGDSHHSISALRERISIRSRSEYIRSKEDPGPWPMPSTPTSVSNISVLPVSVGKRYRSLRACC